MQNDRVSFYFNLHFFLLITHTRYFTPPYFFARKKNEFFFYSFHSLDSSTQWIEEEKENALIEVDFCPCWCFLENRDSSMLLQTVCDDDLM